MNAIHPINASPIYPQFGGNPFSHALRPSTNFVTDKSLSAILILPPKFLLYEHNSIQEQGSDF